MSTHPRWLQADPILTIPAPRTMQRLRTLHALILTKLKPRLSYRPGHHLVERQAGTIPTLAQNIEDAPQAQDPLHPSSVAVQPLPTEDYRRMSRSIAHQTIGSDSIMSYDPSFSTELSPTHGFFHTLWHMPWVASDRITVDYFPGMSRGAWDWRRVALGNRDSTGTTRTHRDRTGVEYKPVQKPLKSWYTGVPPVGKAADWAKRGEKTEPAVDLLSSGTSASGTRSSMATSNMPGSPGPRGGRRRSSRRDSRRLFYSPNQYTYIDVSHNATPPLRVKKKPRQNSTKYSREREKHTTRSHSRRQRERTHHRAHASSQPAPPPPVPPLPTFSNGYAPYAPAPASPFYFFQPPPLTPSNTNVDPNQAHAQTPGLLSPVLMQMQMVPAMFAPASVGTASPPGVAGRGAGGGYGPPGATGNFPGGFGMSPVSESTPKQNQQTL
ncbi:hypothetical protein VNI00_003469 [Paramarasmius palmivorus]|uniref:Uncharacterized protein n=1 Tax=Paramarasmius palmivorus TaxID=297713 RepID=A0AAW0DPP5_9AGAR